MQKNCSKCGAAFHCQNESPGCWCEKVQLDNQVLQRLKENYANCLCPACLKSFEKTSENPAAVRPDVF